MNQQPDKFFREKLEGFQKTAPALAWEKIEAGLDKKNNKGWWLKIAAAILLLAAATFVLWSYRNTADLPVPQTAQKETQKKESTDPVVNEPQPVADNHIDSSPVKENKSTSTKPRVKHHPLKVTSQDNEVIIQQVADNEAKNELPEVAEPEAVTPVEELVDSQPVVADNTSGENTSVQEAESVNLVFTAEEVNDKYLDKVALAKATSAQKKPSTFRKLLDKAYDLKNNQDPFGDLRQKKNEILALNFKSEKRSQNK